MKPLFVAIVLAAVSASATAAEARRCGDVVDGAKIRVAGRVPPIDRMPERDRVPFPGAKTTVTCRIGEGGWLADCASPLADLRGRWLEREMHRRTRVIDERWRGCPLAGRSIRFKFTFEAHGMGFRTPAGPRSE